jgi:hypothetical protein
VTITVSPQRHSRGDKEFVTMLRSLTHIEARHSVGADNCHYRRLCLALAALWNAFPRTALAEVVCDRNQRAICAQ